ncbi:unnamed protein product [Brachionus calyciflorus]|uniref:G-protein coupled receptors family 2 profile 1 domain-containing protein n=1 Tax=Brachionus calyciflorus TaxID=104777 RepID=A0A813W893_9BILA|nr:unnamed protein product [Brachionus calyciflorus]
MNESYCRITNQNPLPLNQFIEETRYLCFYYLSFIYPTSNISEYDSDLFDNEAESIKYMGETINRKWRACSEAAKSCCVNVLSKPVSMNGLYCKPVWDGWSCHQATPAGGVSIFECADHTTTDSCHSILGYGNFECTQDGDWSKLNGSEYADYSKCLEPTLNFKHLMIDVNIICNLISVLFLISGLLVFLSYR